MTNNYCTIKAIFIFEYIYLLLDIFCFKLQAILVYIKMFSNTFHIPTYSYVCKFLTQAVLMVSP